MSDKRDSLGRFTKGHNIFEIIDCIVYCYNEEGELLFFTDDTRVIDYSWGKQANGYSSTTIEGKQVSIHRFVSRPQKDELVDHINRNKKDNRVQNLRNTNKSMNAFNTGIRKNNSSGCTGVWFRKDTKRWAAEIKKDNKKISLGCYPTYEQAVLARKKAERKYYGIK